MTKRFIPYYYDYINKKAEAEKPFGDYLFGEGLGLPTPGNPEEDTTVEWEIYNLVKDFINTSYGSKMDPDFQNKLKMLKKYENLYSQVLTPETNLLYRGVNLNPFDIEVDEIGTKSKTIGGKKYFSAGKTVYKATSPVQSWTTSLKIAHDFTSHYNEFGDTIGVIYMAKIPYDQIIFNSKYFNKKEKEVLRLTNQPLQVEMLISEEGIKNLNQDMEDDDWDW